MKTLAVMAVALAALLGPAAASRGSRWTVTGLPGGTYYLRSTVDPLDLIDEVDEGNNVATVAVRLR